MKMGTQNKHGKYTLYKSGRITNVDRFVNGKLEGTNKSWYPNGNRRWKIIYKQGKANGILKRRYHCNMAVVSGTFQSWYDNGNLMVNCFFADYKLVSDYQSWYENGTVRIKGHYLEGKIDGEYKTWHSNEPGNSLLFQSGTSNRYL